MKNISKRLLTFAIAVMVLGALGVSSASAALPEFSPAGSAANPIKFKYLGEGFEFHDIRGGVEGYIWCPSATGEGKITGSKALSASFTFKGCKGPGGIECHSVGAKKEEVKTEALPSTLAYISKASKEVGIVFDQASKPLPLFAAFECGVSEDGGMRGGPIVPITAINMKVTKLSTSFNVDGQYVQTPRQYENAEGKLTEQVPLVDFFSRIESQMPQGGLKGFGNMSGFERALEKPELEVKA